MRLGMRAININLLVWSLGLYTVDGGIQFSSPHSTICLQGSGTQLHLSENIADWDGTLRIDDEALAGAAGVIQSDGGDKTITFNNGILVNGQAQAQFTGVFDPNDDGGFDQIELQGDHRYRAEAGRILKKIEAFGQNNILEGSPTFTLANANSGGTPGAGAIFIVPEDMYGNNPGSLLVDLQSRLNASIIMDDNTTLSLRDNLVFTNSAYVRSRNDGETANIFLNEMELSFGAGVSMLQPQVINWRRNGKISFCSKVTIGGDDDTPTIWRFRDTPAPGRARYHINGNGNTIELGCNTTIVVDPNTTLYLTDLKLRGLGRSDCDPGESPMIVLSDCTSQIVYQNVSIEFAGPYTFNNGVHTVCGPTTFHVCNYDVTFCQQALLVLEGETLWLDTGPFATDDPQAGEVVFCNNNDAYTACDIPLELLPCSYNGSDNFLFCDCGSIKVKCDCTDLDVGTVIDIAQKGVTIDFSNPATYVAANHTVVNNPVLTVVNQDNLYLAQNKKLNIATSTLLDGNGHAVEFSQDGGPFITVQPGQTLTFSNVELRNFSPADIAYNVDAYGNAGRVLFGPKTRIELRNPCDELRATVGGIPDTCITWTFMTDETRQGALIHGFQNTLDLTTECPVGIFVDNRATLTLHHVRLRNLGGAQVDSGTFGTKPYNVQMGDAASRIVVKDSELVLSGNYTYTQGRFDILRDATISGSYVFAQQSPVPTGMTIFDDSELVIDRNTTYSYDAIPNIGESLDDTRSKIVFTDQSAVLRLNGATLHSTHTGVRLANGTLLIADKSNLTNEAVNSNESAVFVIDATNPDPLDLQVLAGATLCVDGLLETQ